MLNLIIKSKVFRISAVVIIILFNIGCDQISKNMVREKVRYFERISLIDQVLTLTKVENTGAFLGFGSEFPPAIKKVAFTILPATVLLISIFLLFSKFSLNVYSIVGFGFMIGGGMGNVFDRIKYSSVTDFLHLDFGIVSTGIFNMADVSIMFGIVLMAIPHLRRERVMEEDTVPGVAPTQDVDDV